MVSIKMALDKERKREHKNGFGHLASGELDVVFANINVQFTAFA